MHLLQNSRDIETATKIGLSVFEDDECENCFIRVGDGGMENFVPFLIVLDDSDEWVVCAECAGPVL
jgi:hypothetical protein